ncbi:hypothetical protein M5K25_026321 [Dendrobium thyrsiflorum]|uniref:Protein FAR1-RELATED SEQUENCE n=1 Tax=Dendrobium thyrsiflorum TaxID=117978 RepID=A0ABD0TXG9_DENTH
MHMYFDALITSFISTDIILIKEKYSFEIKGLYLKMKKKHMMFAERMPIIVTLVKVKSNDFVCSKADFKKRFDLNSQKKCRRSETRTGYPSLIRFIVKKFIEIHNHVLARLEDRHLLRSCRNIDDDKASVLKSMTKARIRTVNVFSYLVEEVKGVENVGFSKRDAYNFIQKKKRANIKFGDTNAFI